MQMSCALSTVPTSETVAQSSQAWSVQVGEVIGHVFDGALIAGACQFCRVLITDKLGMRRPFMRACMVDLTQSMLQCLKSKLDSRHLKRPLDLVPLQEDLHKVFGPVRPVIRLKQLLRTGVPCIYGARLALPVSTHPQLLICKDTHNFLKSQAQTMQLDSESAPYAVGKGFRGDGCLVV